MRILVYFLLIYFSLQLHAQPDVVAKPDFIKYKKILKHEHIGSVTVDMKQNGKNVMLFDILGREWALMHLSPNGDTLYINYYGYSEKSYVISYDTYNGTNLLPGHCYIYEYHQVGLCTLLIRQHPNDVMLRDSSFIVYNKAMPSLIDPSGQLFEYKYNNDSLLEKVYHYYPDQDTGEYSTFVYDEKKRLKLKTEHPHIGNEQVEEFFYDNNNREAAYEVRDEIAGWHTRYEYFYHKNGLPECLLLYSNDQLLDEYDFTYNRYSKRKKKTASRKK